MESLKKTTATLSLVIGIILTYTASSHAGEMLSPKELVERSDAIAVIYVDLKKGEIKTLEWLLISDHVGSRVEHDLRFKSSSDSLSTLCVPRSEQLKLWIKRYQRWESVKHWRTALKRGRYQSLIYLKYLPQENRFSAICEIETLNAVHWYEHPSFPKWHTEIKKWIKERDSAQSKMNEDSSPLPKSSDKSPLLAE